MVQLSLLPVLASAAVAAAEPPVATAQAIDGLDGATLDPDGPAALDEPAGPPGMTAPAEEAEVAGYGPPGLTPTIMELTCDDDPNWRLRADCAGAGGGAYVSGGVVRGGFGHYFWSGGG
jgi:hypothetical protein